MKARPVPPRRSGTLMVMMLGLVEAAAGHARAEVNLRAAAVAVGVDPDAAVERAREVHAADVEIAQRNPWPPPRLADAMDQERRRLLEGPQVESDVLRQRMDLRALLRLHEAVSVEVPPLVPLRPRGLAALGFGRVEDCSAAFEPWF